MKRILPFLLFSFSLFCFPFYGESKSETSPCVIILKPIFTGEDPYSVYLDTSYDPFSQEIQINVFQTATLAVVICEEDSGAILSTSLFPPVTGSPNQTYIVTAPISPGTYDIFLSMDGYSCQGTFVVEY